MHASLLGRGLAVPGAFDNIDGLDGLNEMFTAWDETIYHQRAHSQTEQTPLARFTTIEEPVLPPDFAHPATSAQP